MQQRQQHHRRRREASEPLGHDVTAQPQSRDGLRSTYEACRTVSMPDGHSVVEDRQAGQDADERQGAVEHSGDVQLTLELQWQDGVDQHHHEAHQTHLKHEEHHARFPK